MARLALNRANVYWRPSRSISGVFRHIRKLLVYYTAIVHNSQAFTPYFWIYPSCSIVETMIATTISNTTRREITYGKMIFLAERRLYLGLDRNAKTVYPTADSTLAILRYLTCKKYASNENSVAKATKPIATKYCTTDRNKSHDTFRHICYATQNVLKNNDLYVKIINSFVFVR